MSIMRPDHLLQARYTESIAVVAYKDDSVVVHGPNLAADAAAIGQSCARYCVRLICLGGDSCR
jgi:hypothetical protein